MSNNQEQLALEIGTAVISIFQNLNRIGLFPSEALNVPHSPERIKRKPEKSIEAPGSAAPKKRKKQAPKDPNAPKKHARNSYNLFFKDAYQSFKVDHPEMKATEITQLIAQQWKEISEDQKKYYEDMYHQQKDVYDEELKAYQQTNKEESAEAVPVTPSMPAVKPAAFKKPVKTVTSAPVAEIESPKEVSEELSQSASDTSSSSVADSDSDSDSVDEDFEKENEVQKENVPVVSKKQVAKPEPPKKKTSSVPAATPMKVAKVITPPSTVKQTTSLKAMPAVEIKAAEKNFERKKSHKSRAKKEVTSN